jgi:AraC-like DNA-binding protein
MADEQGLTVTRRASMILSGEEGWSHTVVQIAVNQSAATSPEHNQVFVVHVYHKGISNVIGQQSDSRGDRINDVATIVNVDDPTMAELLLLLLRAQHEPAKSPTVIVEDRSHGVTVGVLNQNAEPTYDPEDTLQDFRFLSKLHVHQIDHYIRENLSSDLSLEKLCAIVGMSRTTFVCKFKESFGRTPRQYVIESRIRRAQELLLKTNLTMPQIATFCGFADQAHFSMRFKKMMKLTPSMYRRKGL